MKSIQKLVLLAGLGCFVFACSPSPDQKNSENVKLVEGYVNAVEAMDFEAMSNYLDENYLGMGPSYGDSITKAQAVESWKYNIENLYEKIEYTKSKFAAVTIPDGDAKGEWVANWAELTITYKDGNSVKLLANSNYKVENGKIVQSITFYNEADALRQLGYGFVPME
ncbi:nuclear transport factor 2 family protein [Algoriphagus sp. AK58]|uniref:nuclear transport factor 2 family protein n=1 Tax=Algoriphagus sp. AK58 TaxID=1406877 RepID=UPI00164F21E9|nr:nuclear transport factor 2 family protein [Algoriphagus sp. AK58]MBC6365409.1 hypothetical protein [Algoriphagus sp. AK58]